MTDVTSRGHQPRRVSTSSLRVRLRHDGLDWIAEDRPEWRHPNGTLKIAQVAEAAGLHRQSLHRLVTIAERDPDNPTIAAITQLGADTRKVAAKTAFDCIFEVVDLTAQASRAA